MAKRLIRRLGTNTRLQGGQIAAAATSETEILITQTVAPSNGVGAVTLALYHHTSTFTPPGTGTLLSTSLSYVHEDRVPGEPNFYEVIYTDASSATDRSNEVSATTEESGVEPDLINWNAEDHEDTESLLADTTFALIGDDRFQYGISEGSGGIGGVVGASVDIQLDDEEAPPLVGITKSMRYDFNHGNNGATTLTIKRSIPFPDDLRFAWMEIYVKWSEDFSTDFDGSPGSDAYPNDHKFWVITQASDSFTWRFKPGTHTFPQQLRLEKPAGDLEAGDPVGALNLNEDDHVLAQDLWDGEWHRLRMLIANSTTTTSANGLWVIWVDDEILHVEIGFNTWDENGTPAFAQEGAGPQRLGSLDLCHNKDDGPPNTPMSLWVGSIKAWSVNPGW